MLIEEILKRSTIELPGSLTLKEAENLIDYLAEKLPAYVDYHISHHKSILHSPGEGVLKQDGTVKISVNVTNLEKPFAFDNFEFRASDQSEDTSRLSVIRFQLVNGRKLFEYRPEVRELWDQVREKVGQYFGES